MELFPSWIVTRRIGYLHANRSNIHVQPSDLTQRVCAFFIEHSPDNLYLGLCIPRRFSDSAVSEEAAEHQFQIIQNGDDLSEAWFEIK